MELTNASPFPEKPDPVGNGVNPTFSEAWAKKYLQKLTAQDDLANPLNQGEIAAKIAKMLLQSLRTTSAQAWAKTEQLLSQEMIRHDIAAHLIDPWAVAKDSHQIYETALDAYAQQIPLPELSTWIAAEVGQIRQKYTAEDSRLIGFVSMQFHYSEQILLDLTPLPQRSLLSQYFKVIDDHLYMPLQRAYQAAANHDYDSPCLLAVQRLVPLCSEIAANIAAQVLKLYPNYQCYTGRLSDARIQISSIRDIEMFQVYLWVCVLERNISSVQQELFPLCVMLYPRLKVNWNLVRQLIYMIGSEFRFHLSPEQTAHFTNYYDSLWGMFSPQLLPDE